MNFQGVILVGLGGCIGCMLRYALGTQLPFETDRFAWATFSVNMLGCLLIGLGMGKLQDENLKLLLVTGMLGGFTTFSSFAHQALEMTHHGRPGLALAYVVATNVLAVGAVWAGLHLTGPSA